MWRRILAASRPWIGPWALYTFSPDWIRDITFRGREKGYTMKLALAELGEMMYELIEPVEGPTSYHEFLEERGEGLHHLGYFVEDLDVEIKPLDSKGFPLLQSGRGMGTAGDGGYAYFETEPALGHHRSYPDARGDARTRAHLPGVASTSVAPSFRGGRGLELGQGHR